MRVLATGWSRSVPIDNAFMGVKTMLVAPNTDHTAHVVSFDRSTTDPMDTTAQSVSDEAGLTATRSCAKWMRNS